MQPENLTQLLRQHPFISDMDETLLKTLLSCASIPFFPMMSIFSGKEKRQLNSTLFEREG